MFISLFKVLRNPMLLLYSDKEKCEDEYCHFVSDICHYLHKQNRWRKTAACSLWSSLLFVHAFTEYIFLCEYKN